MFLNIIFMVLKLDNIREDKLQVKFTQSTYLKFNIISTLIFWLQVFG